MHSCTCCTAATCSAAATPCATHPGMCARLFGRGEFGTGRARETMVVSKKPFYVYFRILHAYTIIYLKYRVYCWRRRWLLERRRWLLERRRPATSRSSTRANQFCEPSSFVCVKVIGGGSVRRFHMSVPIVGQIKHKSSSSPALYLGNVQLRLPLRRSCHDTSST